MSSREIGIEEARKTLGDLVTAARYGHTTIITRNGKPAAAIVPVEEPTVKLKYRRTAYPAGIVQIAGFWDAWREQIPALPDDPTDLNDETLATIAHSPITYERDGTILEATLSNLEVRTGSKGPVGLGTLVEKDTVPTRRGKCAVCGRYQDALIEREDASGLTGWVCEEHDDLDIVFA